MTGQPSGPTAIRRLGRVPILALTLSAAWWAAPEAAAQEVSGLQAALVVEGAMVEAIARAEPSVVAICRIRKDQAAARLGGIDVQRQLFDPNSFALQPPGPTSPDFVPTEFGTGVVIDAGGYILTNYHVLGDPKLNDYYVWVNRKPFQVIRVSGTEQVQAGDPWTDLAVLKINTDGLQPITFGDASQLKKGMLVIALGNPYAIARDGEVSASWGIIANLSRSVGPHPNPARPELTKDTLHHYGTLIQTDARLNLGTSGGALINLKGEMIGLTTSLAPLAGFEKSAGFAIPVDDVFQRVVAALKEGKLPEFGFLGVQPEDLTDAERQSGRFGARINSVVSGTPAAQAGVQDGDIVTHVDGQPIYDKNDLFRELSQRSVNDRVQLTLLRLDADRQRRRTTHANVLLAKKYIDSARASFAQQPSPLWRGMQVEYATALPQTLLRQAGSVLDPDGCVGVLEVEADTPAWKAGFRPGMFISHVGDQRVASPHQFHQLVSRQSGAVRLMITAGRGQDAVRIVPP